MRNIMKVSRKDLGEKYTATSPHKVDLSNTGHPYTDNPAIVNYMNAVVTTYHSNRNGYGKFRIDRSICVLWCVEKGLV